MQHLSSAVFIVAWRTGKACPRGRWEFRCVRQKCARAAMCYAYVCAKINESRPAGRSGEH